MKAHAFDSNSFRDSVGYFLASCSYSAGAVADYLVDYLAVSVIGAFYWCGVGLAGGYPVSPSSSFGLAA